MRLTSIVSGKAIWLFETQELNPRGLDLHPIFAGIKARYGFSTPRTRDEVDNAKDGVKFEHGSFKSNNGSEAFEVALTVFADGLVAETKADTVIAEAFLVDLLHFSKLQYGLAYEDSMVRTKRYGSAVVVESQGALAQLAVPFATVIDRLSQLTGKEFGVRGVTLGFDPVEQNDGLGPFQFERREGVPLSANRFFSRAPVGTSDHLQILEAIEQIRVS